MGVSARILRTDESPTHFCLNNRIFCPTCPDRHPALLFDGQHWQCDKLEGRMECPRSSNVGQFVLVQRPRPLCHRIAPRHVLSRLVASAGNYAYGRRYGCHSWSYTDYKIVCQGFGSFYVHIRKCNINEIMWFTILLQELTFTNWFNDRLRGSKPSFSGAAVSDLSVDLKDGTLLIKLLENLTNKKIRGYEKAPKITAHKMVNLDLAFTHMRNEGIKLIGIGKYVQ